ncbi:MAG: hypothetical protein ABW185_09715 [Sedimenticola sp.]
MRSFDELMLKLLLHHSRTIEEQARTGVQRRFKEALLSLETDTPNIGLLIECIDKIVFSGDKAAVSVVQREDRSRDKAEAVDGHELGSLAIASPLKKTDPPVLRLPDPSCAQCLTSTGLVAAEVQSIHGIIESEQI